MQQFRHLGRVLTSVNGQGGLNSWARALTTSTKAEWFFSESAGKTSGHSSLLSDVHTVYEIVSDSVAPKDWDAYIKHKGSLIELCNGRRDFKADHVGSWHFIYGDVIFRAFHLYRYSNGWTDIDQTRLARRVDSEFQTEYKSGLGLIRQQSTEFLKSFSFWPVPDRRTGGNIYDVRSYKLIPGSMYDWGNYWARGIDYRKRVREDLPYAGLFTQVGDLQIVYHIWVYSSLEDRNNCRKDTWHQESWPEIVSNTVPLIKSMKTRILEPLPFSPTQ